MRFVKAQILWAACCLIARADVISFITPLGSMAGGQPVDAEATITTGAGTITVDLKNLGANPKSVAQNLSNLEFSLGSGTATGAKYKSGKVDSAPLESVATSGTPTVGTTHTCAFLSLTCLSPIGWALTTPSSTSIKLNDIGCAFCAGPRHTIIGPPDMSGMYSNADGSIAKTGGPHNPFINQEAVWVIDAPNVSAGTTITEVVFSFGTTSGANVTGAVVPEPGFYGVLAFGLAGMLLAGRRRLSH